MSRSILTPLALLALMGSSAHGQLPFVGPGSTAQGDYLRGVGVAAYGMGVGEFFEAQANAINVETGIKLNEYIYAVLNHENEVNAQHRSAMLDKKKEEYNKIRQRVLENPEALDVDKGNALNAVLEKMNSGLIQESTHKYADVPLSTEQVKRIPFTLAEKGVKSFSMAKLTIKQRGKWQLAFQDPQFDIVRKRYDDALDYALDLHLKSAAQIEAIDRLEDAVAALSDKLDQVMGARPADTRYIDAKAMLRGLNATIEMLKKYKIQPALVDLDQYHGTTINDLRIYMRKHNLRFATAETPEERELYPELYTNLRIHYEKVASGLGDKIHN